MLIKSIKIDTELKTMEDIENDNVDVSIELEDEREYNVLVVTYKNILSLINDEESDFLFPMGPMIIVKELNMENIERAIEAYAKDDADWLKLYHLATSIDTKTLNVLTDRWFERTKLIAKLLEKDQSIDLENDDLIDFDIKNYEES
jgi:hypothetical protein